MLLSNEAARPVPQGKHDDGTPLKKLRPRTPLGPSEVRRDGMPSSGESSNVQKSCKEREDRQRMLSSREGGREGEGAHLAAE